VRDPEVLSLASETRYFWGKTVALPLSYAGA